MTTDIDHLLSRLHDLQRQHEKAAKKRDEWAEKAAHFRSKIESYQEVLADQGVEVNTAPVAPAGSSLADAVLEAARSLNGEPITVDSVRERLPESYRGKATSTISRALIRLAPEDGSGPLGILKKGVGRRPSIYVWLLDEPEDSDASDEADNVKPFARVEKM